MSKHLKYESKKKKLHTFPIVPLKWQKIILKGTFTDLFSPVRQDKIAYCGFLMYFVKWKEACLSIRFTKRKKKELDIER